MFCGLIYPCDRWKRGLGRLRFDESESSIRRGSVCSDRQGWKIWRQTGKLI